MTTNLLALGVVTRAQAHVVRRPVSSKLSTHYGAPDDSKAHVIVVLTDMNGHRGWGEATPLPHFNGETAESIKSALDNYYLPALEGTRICNIAATAELLVRKLPQNSSARCAVDMALHDLLSQAIGVPLFVVLGGQEREVVEITRPIGICSITEAQGLTEKYVESGHRTLKLKVGGNPADDIARVKAVRDTAGREVNIRIDANRGYDFTSAMHVLDRLAACDLQYCEQPLAAQDYAGHAALKRTGVRIALDEGVHTAADAIRAVEEDAADVFVIKMIKCAGLSGALSIDAVARAAGKSCSVVSPYDTQIGTAHALHLASALPSCTMACELTAFAAQPEMAATSHVLSQGALKVSPAAGTGVSAIFELGELAQL